MIASADDLSRLEQHLGRLLVIGLTTSSVALGVGLALYLFAPGARLTPSLLNAGLLVLMATPMLRVVVSMVGYFRMRDWFFALTTLAVLIELSVTVFFALRQR